MHGHRTSQAILSAILIAITGPGSGLALDWEIETPTAQEIFATVASIGGEGTGPENEGFTFRVRQGGVTKMSTGGTVNAYGHWGETIQPPAGGYSCGDATLEILEGIYVRDSVGISFDDSGCG